MALPFRRTIVIGLGGTGVTSVRRLKRMFLNRFGEVPHAVQLITFDTNTDRNEEYLPDKNGENVTLPGHEFNHITSAPPKQVLEHSRAVQQWFPKEDVRNDAVKTGAGQHRPLGRLAFYSQVIASNGPYEVINNSYNELISYDIEQKLQDQSGRVNEGFELSQAGSVTVYIVASLGGGTGAGMFIDMSYLCQYMFEQNNRSQTDNIVGFLLLPGGFAGGAGTGNVQGNGYAALKEFDHLMGRSIGEGEEVYYGKHQTGNIEIRWEQPMDKCFLIGDVIAGRGRVRELSDLQAFLGELLFAQTTVGSGQTADIIDQMMMHSAEEWPSGKIAWYGGAGMARIELPVERLTNIAIEDKIAKLCGNMLSSDETTIGEEVHNQLVNWQLEEEKSDQVIDDLIPSKLTAERLREPHKIEADLRVQKILDWRKNEIKDRILPEYERQASEKLENKHDQVKSELQTKVNALLHEKGGVAHCLSFLNQLKARFNQFQEMMDQEQTDFGGSKEAILDELNENEDNETREIEEAASVPFWRRQNSLLSLVSTLESRINDESERLWETVRRSYASQLFSYLRSDVNDYIQKLQALKEATEAVRNEAFQNASQARSKRSIDPFTHELGEDVIKQDVQDLDEEITAGQVMRNLSQAGGLLSLNPDKSTLMSTLRSMIEEDYAKRIKSITIEDILERISNRDKEELHTLIRNKLIEPASTLWECHAYEVAPSELYIIGVPDAEHTVLDPQNIPPGQINLSQNQYQPASTRDPYSVAAFKFTMTVPAHVIDGVSSFRDSYWEKEGEQGFTHHIDRNWTGGKNLLDLFPISMEEATKQRVENRRLWAISFAQPFQLISRQPSGRFYLQVSNGDGGVVEHQSSQGIDLGKDPEEAFNKMSGDEELMNTVSEHIDSVLDSQDTKVIIDGLENHMEALEQGKLYFGTEEKNEAQEDMEAIEQFIEERLAPFV